MPRVAGFLQSRICRRVLETTLPVLEKLDRTPFGSQQEIEPAIIVSVRPERTGDHTRLLQSGSSFIGHGGEAAVVVPEQRAVRRKWEHPGNRPRPDKKIQISVPVKVSSRDGASTVPQVRESSLGGTGKPAFSII